ncbi:flavin-containing monooxygenase 1-like [Apostichopus japonicus]|uniref:flavin-containing monooxygenase 1-like n=1 Tax=Stichopus japonicus TaxID=307972 RepID=UPI003AB67350
MAVSKTVAIVGAGPCGLGAVKTCLEEGLVPTAFDKFKSIGGMWNYDPDTSKGTSGRTYRSLVTNSCTIKSCYSDFPFPKDAPPFVPHKTYLKYLNDYADHFKLRGYIQLDTTVVKIEPAEDYDVTGRWIVRTQKRGEETVSQTFDYVMICSGFFTDPFIPKVEGDEIFEGEILHTAQYRTDEPFKDKTVLVIGESLSAADIAVETSISADQVYLSVRHGFWVFPRRTYGGMPYDAFLQRRVTMSIVPTWLLRYVFQLFLEIGIDHQATGIKPERRLFEENFAVNDLIFTQITCGKIRIRPGIKRFLTNGVEFEDGTRLEGLDVVVFGTGYNVKTPYIDDSLVSDDIQTRNLYKYAIPINLPHPTIACIGLFPTDSGFTPVGEQQSRWAVRIFKGLITLPPVKKMEEDIREKETDLCNRYGRPKLMVPGIPLTDELTQDIGCYPNLAKIFLTDPWLAVMVFLAPVTPFTYRILGPHSWPGARDAVLGCCDSFTSGIGGNKTTRPASSHYKYLIVALFILLIGMQLWK